MPEFFYGFDTSNYTTSCAVFRSDGSYHQERKLLPVEKGEKGLRQSDAVFHHTRALPQLFKALSENEAGTPSAIGCSVSPRDEPGSYMPCFLVGETAASVTADALGVPLYRFSHQAGHVAAAALTCGDDRILTRPFFAFHVSGGTTDLILVEPDEEHVIRIMPVAASLDLKAGQAVDRVGVMLGLSFPAGPALEKLADESNKAFKPKIFVKDGCASFSGIENKCMDMKRRGEGPADIARFCLCSVAEALLRMAGEALSGRPGTPILFAGGVMSDMIIRDKLSGLEGALFSDPALSSDNAVGIAYLTYLAHERRCPR